MTRARQLRQFSLLLLLLAFSPEGTLGAALAKAKPKKAKAKKKPAASSGGGFGAVAPKAAKASVLQPPQWKQAVQAKGAMLVAKPGDPQLWLEMGALLVKGREYAEAERVLRYLHRTSDIGLRFEASQRPLHGFSDSDWDIKHSTSGVHPQQGRGVMGLQEAGHGRTVVLRGGDRRRLGGRQGGCPPRAPGH